VADPPALIVAGPTCSGKSALALGIAEAVGGIVINADAMQVYRELRVLTARPTVAEEARVPHRLYGVRPAVEAGERLGFLPGDMKEKVDPYLRPLYDALYDCMPPEQVERRIASGEIEIAPIAFMRGRTLADAFVILDEAQNTTPAQMKMFLTRFGQNSRMVVCGDPRQVDIPGGDSFSGLADAVKRLEGVEGIAVTRFTRADVVRHPIVGRIVDAYEGKDG
jgi:phosphate starvation-inducible PhoH-like protein